MNVWLVQTGEPLPLEDNVKKMRTGLLAEKLAERGHSIIWWASSFDHFKKNWVFKEDTEVFIRKNLKIKVLKGIGYERNISFSRIVDHRVIARKFRKQSGTILKPDIIIVSMPPHDLAYEAVKFAGDNGIPVLLDIRDPWPEIFLEHVPQKLKKLARLFLYKDFNMTEKAIKNATGLVAATDSFLGWALARSGRAKRWTDRVFYLGYKKKEYPRVSLEPGKFKELISKIQDKFVVFFVGSLSKTYHDPSIILKVADKLTDFKDICFVIAGNGELFKEFEAKARQKNNVYLTGWLNKKEIDLFLRHSSVGVCPSAKYDDLPTNKAFAYLSAGLPVISSFQGELKDMIERYNIGFNYNPDDEEGLADIIKKTYSDKDLYNNISANAKNTFQSFFLIKTSVSSLKTQFFLK